MSITIDLEGDGYDSYCLRATTSSGRSYRLDRDDAGWQLLRILQAEQRAARPALDTTALLKLVLAAWERLPEHGAGKVKRYGAKGKNPLMDLEID